MERGWMITIIVVLILCALFIVWENDVDAKHNAWNQEVKRRLSEKIDGSGILFNMTEPDVDFYLVEHMYCLSEEQWIEVNNIVSHLIAYKINGEPNLTLYTFEDCPYIYFGYVEKTYVGFEYIGDMFNGYKIQIFMDC